LTISVEPVDQRELVKAMVEERVRLECDLIDLGLSSKPFNQKEYRALIRLLNLAQKELERMQQRFGFSRRDTLVMREELHREFMQDIFQTLRDSEPKRER